VPTLAGFEGFQYAVARGEPVEQGGEGMEYFAAWGCTDSIQPPEPGTATTISIDMHNLYPAIEGAYDIVTEIDLLGALPDNVEEIVRLVGDIFDNPGVGILRLAGAAFGGDYWDEGLFDLLFDMCTGPGRSEEGANPRCDEAGQVAPTDLGVIAGEVLNTALTAGLSAAGRAGEIINDVLAAGNDFFDNAERFTLGGTLFITQEPDTAGNLGDENHVKYNRVTWLWRDVERTIYLTDDESLLEASGMSAAIIFHPDLDETYAIALDPFGLQVNYGDILIFALERIVFPTLIDEDVDSFEDLFDYLIDCEQLAVSLADAGIPTSVAESLCEGLQDMATSAISGWLSSLVADTSNFYHMGTPSDDPCPLSFPPSSNDFEVYRMGGPSDLDSCFFDGTIRYSEDDVEGDDMAANWWAERL
jgi:hypothetical protein